MREEPAWRKRQDNRRPGAREQFGKPVAPGPPTPTAPAPPPQQLSSIKGDVIWALRGTGCGLSVFDIGAKIAQNRRIRYSESKILHVLEMLEQDGKVEKSEAPGRVTYAWKVQAG